MLYNYRVLTPVEIPQHESCFNKWAQWGVQQDSSANNHVGGRSWIIGRRLFVILCVFCLNYSLFFLTFCRLLIIHCCYSLFHWHITALFIIPAFSDPIMHYSFLFILVIHYLLFSFHPRNHGLEKRLCISHSSSITSPFISPRSRNILDMLFRLLQIEKKIWDCHNPRNGILTVFHTVPFVTVYHCSSGIFMKMLIL